MPVLLRWQTRRTAIVVASWRWRWAGAVEATDAQLLGVRRIRELIFGAYRVIYNVKDKVEILTVCRGSQLLDVSEIDDEQSSNTD